MTATLVTKWENSYLVSDGTNIITIKPRHDQWWVDDGAYEHGFLFLESAVAYARTLLTAKGAPHA